MYDWPNILDSVGRGEALSGKSQREGSWIFCRSLCYGRRAGRRGIPKAPVPGQKGLLLGGKASPFAEKAVIQAMPAAGKSRDLLEISSKSTPLPALFTRHVNAFLEVAARGIIIFQILVRNNRRKLIEKGFPGGGTDSPGIARRRSGAFFTFDPRSPI